MTRFTIRALRLINADAARWIEASDESFDVAFVDFPDPSTFALGKLYSVPFYALPQEADRIARTRGRAGDLALLCTACVLVDRGDACASAGYQTYPYHTYVPSFGEWGFILAGGEAPFTPPAHYRLPMRYLNAEVTHEMFTFPPDMQRIPVEANHLNSQALVRYFDEDWHRVIR